MNKNSQGCIGLFNDSFPPIMDGVTLAVQNYAKWLGDSGREICVVTPWNPIRESQNYPVLRYFSLPIKGREPYRYGYPKLDPAIWLRLRRKPFALLHSHCPFSSGRLAVYVKRHQHIPLIGTFHSKYREDLVRGFQRHPWMVKIIMRRILDFFNACDYVWIPQASVEETIREYGYRGRLQVVENGNDFSDIAESDLPLYRAKARKNQGIADYELSLLFVGQHIYEKGVDVLIDALAMLKGIVPFRMNFVGMGYAYEDMQKKVGEYEMGNVVRFHGNISDREALREIYAASDLFLFPSYYDNAPLVVREAAAMGTPSVLVEGSTAAEPIRDGVNGFTTRKTPEAYAELIRLLNIRRGDIREAGIGARHSLVRSWQDVVKEVEWRYKEIIEEHGRR